MSKVIIDAVTGVGVPDSLSDGKSAGPYIDVNECFCEAFQGEGAYSGVPALFLRVAECHVGCRWCDTKEAWGKGIRFSVSDLVSVFDSNGLVQLMERGHHLVVTGGSPLLQQDSLVVFLRELSSKCNVKPFIEIENECSMVVSRDCESLFGLIDCWNCSPKLSGSGVSEEKRYCPDAVRQVVSMAKESWFKFVVSPDHLSEDWYEIDRLFIRDGLVCKDRIILMPEGSGPEELCSDRRAAVAEFAVSHDVRYSERVHVNLYGRRRSV